MLFQGSDTYITLQRDYYLQVIDIENQTNHPEGTKLMYVYWNYSDPDGWASVSDEYITCDEIRALCKGLRELENGSRTDFAMEIYGSFQNTPFIKIHVAKREQSIHVELSVHFPYADNDPSVSLKMTEEEWQPYLAEFLDWDKEYSIALGERVKTLVETRDYPQESHFVKSCASCGHTVCRSDTRSNFPSSGIMLLPSHKSFQRISSRYGAKNRHARPNFSQRALNRLGPSSKPNSLFQMVGNRKRSVCCLRRSTISFSLSSSLSA